MAASVQPVNSVPPPGKDWASARGSDVTLVFTRALQRGAVKERSKVNMRELQHSMCEYRRIFTLM